MTIQPGRPSSDDDEPARRENMRLREEVTALRLQRAADARAVSEAVAAREQMQARLDAVLGATTWRLSQRLIRLAELAPPGLRRIMRNRIAGPEQGAEAPPAEPSREAALLGPFQAFAVFEQSMAEMAASFWYDALTPQVSIIILNWNHGEMTLACVRYVLRHTHGCRFEIIIADNGSTPDELAILSRGKSPARILPLGTNLFYGEANNIAVEHARGEYVAFLNNDAFVHDGWIEPLIDTIERLPNVGAVGSRILYPDGTLQEAGGLVSWDGYANQLGKFAAQDDERYGSLRQVDYVSGASLLMRRRDFLDVMGFELCYEPAYFEDVDLCLKLRARDQAIYYCPSSIVTHIENATSLDKRLNLQLENIIQQNRITFSARWSDFLLGQPSRMVFAPARPLPSQRNGRRVALMTPYMLTPGGGERYLLSVGAALAAVADVTLVTMAPCSDIRLRRIGLDLNIDVSALSLMTLSEARDVAFDLVFFMGNAVLPQEPGFGRHNVFICQFPFPMRDADAAAWREHWDAYCSVIVYSEFALRHFKRRRAELGLSAKPMHVISPPVPQVLPAAKRPIIISVGRFFAGQHTKRQDLMVAAFRQLVAEGAACELHLAGSLRPEPQHRAYYLSVVDAAQGLPVVFHPNIDAEQLSRLYAAATVYWHMTGYGTDPATQPELSEHFGIAVVEAMSAGCVPVAFNSGGPAEIISDGEDGYLVNEFDQLLQRTRALMDDPATTAGMARKAARRATHFTDAIFAQAVQGVAETWLPHLVA